MSTKSSKLEASYYSDVKTMHDKEQVARFRWDKELGDRLKSVRGKVSRRKLAEMIMAQGVNCTQQYIQKLEDGNSRSISTELVDAIAHALEIDYEQVIPAIRIQLPK